MLSDSKLPRRQNTEPHTHLAPTHDTFPPQSPSGKGEAVSTPVNINELWWHVTCELGGWAHIHVCKYCANIKILFSAWTGVLVQLVCDWIQLNPTQLVLLLAVWCSMLQLDESQHLHIQTQSCSPDPTPSADSCSPFQRQREKELRAF